MFHQSLFTERTLRTALQVLNDAQRLGAHPLAGAAFVRSRAAQQTTHTSPQPAGTAGAAGANGTTHGVALQAALREAIASFRPSTPQDLNDLDWRIYIALSEQYGRGLRPLRVAEMLALQEGAYHDARRRGIIRLATQLIAWERVAQSALADGSITDPTPPLFLAPDPPPNPMIGRDATLADMIAQLTAGNDVVVYGLPGMGKSTLLVAACHAADLQRHFADGVLWAGLGPASTPRRSKLNPPSPGAGLGEGADLRTFRRNSNSDDDDSIVLRVLGEWMLALGAPRSELTYLTTVSQRAKAVRSAIGQKRLLLVMDDVWTPEAAQALRVGGPHCAHVMSTRLAHVAAELTESAQHAHAQAHVHTHSMTLPELSADDSLGVLAQLAPAVARTHPAQLAELAILVGGLPLALMLMGRHLHTATTGLARRLENALVALRTPEARLRLKLPGSAATLRDVIAHSETVLDEPTRRAFHGVGVFPPKPNTFSEAAALATADCTTDALDALVDTGLLEVLDGRYTLHRVLGEYGQVVAANLAETQTRFVDFFIALVETNQRHYDLLSTERQNIICAIETAHSQRSDHLAVRGANAIFHFLISRTDYVECTRLIELVGLQELRAELEADQAEMLLNTGRLHFRQGDYDQAESCLRRAYEMASQHKNQRLVVDALRNLSNIASIRGDDRTALNLIRQGTQLAQAFAYSDGQSAMLISLGTIANNRGHLRTVERALSQGLSLAQSTNNQELICAHSIGLGAAIARRGDVMRGAMLTIEGLELARKIGHQEVVCTGLLVMGLGALEFSMLDVAELQLQEGLALARKIENKRLIGLFLGGLGKLSLMRGDLPTSETHLTEALQLSRTVGHPWDVCLILESFILLYRQRNDDTKAQETNNELTFLAKKLRYRRWRGQ